MNHHRHVEKASTGSVQKLEELLSTSDNNICADCGSPHPIWASTNIGVFICVKCCNIHKSLGAHISKVLSITSDEWSEVDVESMIEIGGNSCVNAIYEEFIPEGVLKPKPTASSEESSKFIRSKYEFQEFLKPCLRIASSKGPYTSIEFPGDTDNANTTNNPKKEQLQVSKVEVIGELKVKVIKGTNLAVRDVLTSDPYVVLTFGQQRIQTSIIQSNLNPIWNEEFKLSVPPQYGTLKLQVFDHDKLFVDDTMGDAEIDLQATITAAMTFADADLLLQDMQIGKWLKSSDNALIDDSTINIVDGKIKQDIFLKLQNVESGEIQIEMEWIPLKQTF